MTLFFNTDDLSENLKGVVKLKDTTEDAAVGNCTNRSTSHENHKPIDGTSRYHQAHDTDFNFSDDRMSLIAAMKLGIAK